MNRDHETCSQCRSSRRDFIQRGLASLGIAAGMPLFLRETQLAMAADAAAGVSLKHPERILVVIELSGGNDGLNTVVPYANDDYYRLRPRLAVAKDAALRINDEFGFHPNLIGMERIFKDGRMAVVHGCSYPNPNRSHFVSMKFWHTGVPNAAESRGWLGRFADTAQPQSEGSYIVNVAAKQSPAVTARIHSPVVFNEPNRFARVGGDEQKEIFRTLARKKDKGENESLNFLRAINSTADESSEFVRNACAEFRAGHDYGRRQIGVGLRRVAAMIKADAPTRIYYTSYGSFDTHSGQAAQQSGMFNGLSDGVYGFLQDLEKMGRLNHVAVLMFTEFGRRVAENASAGTDHGVASPMFILGGMVKGGFYGEHPSLTDLDQGDLKMTTDFRTVYATMMKEWMGFEDTNSVLKANFATLGAFA